MDKLIQAPSCLSCKHYDLEKDTCPAYPNGQTEEEKIRWYLVKEGYDCGNGVRYEMKWRDEKKPQKLQIRKKLKNVMEKL